MHKQTALLMTVPVLPKLIFSPEISVYIYRLYSPLRFLCPALAGQDTVDVRSNVEALRWPLGVPKLDTAPNRALQAVLDELRRQRGAYMFLRVARRCASVSATCHASGHSKLCAALEVVCMPAALRASVRPSKGFDVCTFCSWPWCGVSAACGLKGAGTCYRALCGASPEGGDGIRWGAETTSPRSCGAEETCGHAGVMLWSQPSTAIS